MRPASASSLASAAAASLQRIGQLHAREACPHGLVVSGELEQHVDQVPAS